VLSVRAGLPAADRGPAQFHSLGALAGKEGGHVGAAGRGGRVVAGAPSLGDANMGVLLAGKRPVQRRRFDVAASWAAIVEAKPLDRAPR
jgi:hypothetical protein